MNSIPQNYLGLINIHDVVSIESKPEGGIRIWTLYGFYDLSLFKMGTDITDKEWEIDWRKSLCKIS